MRKVAIITSRQHSSRLPDKAMALINDKPMLWHIVQRVEVSDVDETVVATTESSDDIVRFCVRNLIPCWIGEEDDQLSRIYDTALKFDTDVIVRIWGDPPFIDPTLINETIKLFTIAKLDYAHTVNYPRGLRVAVFTFKSLKQAQKHMDYKERHIFNEVNEPVWWEKHYKVGALTSKDNLSHIKLDVDTQEDLDRARFIYEKIYTGGIFKYKDIEKWM